MRNELRAIGLSVIGYAQFAFAVLGFIIFATAVGDSCTPGERLIVRDVVQLIEDVCADVSVTSQQECLLAAQMKLAKAAGSGSVATSASAPPVVPPVVVPPAPPPPASCISPVASFAPPVASSVPPVAASSSPPDAGAGKPPAKPKPGKR